MGKQIVLCLPPFLSEILHATDQLQQGWLAATVPTYDSGGFTAPDFERRILQCPNLMTILLETLYQHLKQPTTWLFIDPIALGEICTLMGISENIGKSFPRLLEPGEAKPGYNNGDGKITTK